MKLIGVCPVRNEDWVLGMSLRALLMWCDEVVVLDHASTDRTRVIIQEVRLEAGSRIRWIEDRDPVWQEMAHRQSLLESARAFQATHIVMVDADEILTGNLLPTIRDSITRAPAGTVTQLPWICVEATGSLPDQYYSSGMWARSQVSIAFADDPRACWKARDGYDFHHRHPMGIPFVAHTPISSIAGGGLMHLQFASRRRLLAKQTLYQVTERLRWSGREPVSVVRERYSLTVREALRARKSPVPAEWWAPYQHLTKYLDVHATPWQEEQCRAMVRENPGIEQGLDDFGTGLLSRTPLDQISYY